jgi:hypothetical protein
MKTTNSSEKIPQLSIKAPYDLYCPITHQIPDCPVKVSPDDRQNYEALSIAQWMKQKIHAPRSPFNQASIEKKLIFNKMQFKTIQAFFAETKKTFEEKNQAALNNPHHEDYQAFKKYLEKLNKLADEKTRQAQVKKIAEKLQNDFPMIRLEGFEEFIKPKSCFSHLPPIFSQMYAFSHMPISIVLGITAAIKDLEALNALTLLTNEQLSPIREVASLVSILLQIFPALIDFGCNVNSETYLIQPSNYFILGAINLIPALAYGLLFSLSYGKYFSAEACENLSPEFSLAALMLASTSALNLIRAFYYFINGAQVRQERAMSQHSTLQIEEIEDTIIDIAFESQLENIEEAAAAPLETTSPISRPGLG